ncbi:MAG: glycosyltransferase family 1 protein [Chloroflexi bacterium]|nr:glycosyltransferase family 1 protein [Chloroflexota bacterium]MCY4246837.1 glycosyltransferase family 1 protein [Chloroflexota bacterium]
MPRIALDYTPAIEQRGGIGRYVRDLTAALAHIDADSDYQLFVAGATHSSLPKAPAANFMWRATPASPRWLARLWHRARFPLPVEIFTGRIDLFHATDFVLPPTLPAARTLLTVHDLSFVRVPEAASPPLKAYLDAVVPRSVARAQHILADSQATKDDLVALYGAPADKITVLYCGVDARFQPVRDRGLLGACRRKYGLAGVDYLLSVGTVQPRKNYSRVIEAVAAARQQGCDLHYAIAGGKGWLEDEMRATIARLGAQPYVHLLGLADDADLPALYSGARALVMASLYEGFGLPALEAFACGTPVISSNLSSLPEVAGEAALLVDPYDVAGIAEAVLALEKQPALRQRLAQAGYQRAAGFTWQRSARQLRSIYAALLGE